MDKERVLDSLKHWNCDVDGALERFVDDSDLYVSCLEIFAKDENFENLRKALEVQDYEAAFKAAHTLKGVAGNLGLTPLLHAIVNIVEPLRAKDYSNLMSLYEGVIENYRIYISFLE